MTHQIERRNFGQSVQLRTAADGKSQIISGYAAVFYRVGEPGTQYPLWPGCVERILRGAFDNALQRADDVRCLFNHDVNQIFGRTTSQTLLLKVDDIGLFFEDTLPDTEDGRSLASKIQRKDVTGCSFSFTSGPKPAEWTTEKTPDGVTFDVRNIVDVTLFDVGPVTFPAYTATEVEVAKRSLDLARRSRPPVADDSFLRRRFSGLA